MAEENLRRVARTNAKGPVVSRVRIDRLLAVNNPIKDPPWAGINSPITEAQVMCAIRGKRFEPKWGTANHIERIAYLVEHPDPKPIEIDVGVPVLNYYVNWIIIDGNHRLAAAWFRGNQTIKACISGQVSFAGELLGVHL